MDNDSSNKLTGFPPLPTLPPLPPIPQQQQQLHQWLAIQKAYIQVAAKTPEPPPKVNEFVEWAERVRMSRIRKPVFMVVTGVLYLGVITVFIALVWAALYSHKLMYEPALRLLGVGVVSILFGVIGRFIALEDHFWTKPTWME